MRQFCESLKRQSVVGPKAGWAMDKRSVIERLLAAVTPHPSLGKPRLWSHGADDAGVTALPWPLSTEAPAEIAKPPSNSNVVSLER